MISIADIPMVDDLNVPVNADEYQDQVGPAPIVPGIYRLIPTQTEVRTNKDGSILLVDDKYPIVTIKQVKVVEPVESERLVGVFTDIRTKPFRRKGPTGAEQSASDLQDFLRAVDATVSFEGFDHMKQLLQQAFEQQAPFMAEIGWNAYDKDYVEQAFAELHTTAKEAKAAGVAPEIINGIYAKARKRTKDFFVGGVLQQAIVGASGETLDAKPSITRYYPSTDDKTASKLGPYKKYLPKTAA